MAMNKAVLGAAIAKLITADDAPSEMKGKINKLWTDIAGEIITHIQTNAEVVAGIPVSTTGSSSAQAGTTTASGKIV